MIIGLSGKMGTGKSTLANHIMNKYKSSTTVKIAGLLYELQDMIYSKLNMKLVGEKDRPLLIALGMWGRDQDQNFWTSKAMEKAKLLELIKDVIIIDDIRFPNEAQAILDNNGILIRIEGKQRGPNLTEDMMNNVSETALDSFPFENVIDNSTGLNDTIRQLEQILNRR